MTLTEFRFSIKERTEAGQWKDLQLEGLAGKSLETLFKDLDGKEIVAQLEFAGEVLYFCGTKHWIERMSRKGKAGSFTAAVEILKQRRPDLLKEEIPTPVAVAEIFGDARLLSYSSTTDHEFEA